MQELLKRKVNNYNVDSVPAYKKKIRIHAILVFDLVKKFHHCIFMSDIRSIYAVVDLETTGGSPGTDRVIEIAILIWDGVQILQRYQSLVNPGRPIDRFVQDMTGIKDEMVQKAPSFADIAHEVWSILEGKIFVAHNVRFDLGMLRREFARLEMSFHPVRLDTVTMAKEAFPEVKSFSLGNICRHLGIDIINRHRAMGDAEATVVLFEKIMALPDRDRILRLELNQGIDVDALPQGVSADIVGLFPDEPGLLMVRDAEDKLLFVEGGSSGINLLKRFTQLMPKSFPQEYHRVTSLLFEETGSELLARLLAVDVRARYCPDWNPPLNDKPCHWELYTEKNEAGLLQLKIGKRSDRHPGLCLPFSTRSVANRVLQKILKDARYYMFVKTLQKADSEAQKLNLLSTIEKKVLQTMQQTIFPRADFAIQLPGKTSETSILVIIADNQLKGYRMLDKEYPIDDWNDLLSGITTLPDIPDTHKYIRQFMRKKHSAKIVYPDA